MEQADWIAGIVSALLAAVGTVTSILALRTGPSADRPGPTSNGLTQVGRVPSAASWLQDRRPRFDAGTMSRPGRTAVGAQILTGMGGVGKTQLAARFARQLVERRQLDLLVWVTASSRDAIVARYAEAATVLGLAGASVAASDAATRMLAWLAHTERRWLVVLDNLDSPADAAGWWPPMSVAGRTLVTSRVRDVTWDSDTRSVIPVGLFTPDEAAAYLHSAVTDPTHRDGAVELAADLGYLPIALAQATAYIRERRISCAEYRHELADRCNRLNTLLPDPTVLPDEHGTRLDAAWSMSLDAVDRMEPAGLAAPILHMAGLLDPNAFPAGLFTTFTALTHLSRAAGFTQLATPNQVRQALHHLHRYHLITFDIDGDLLQMHALVQRAIRDLPDPDSTGRTGRAAANALLQTWPHTERETATTALLRANATALRQHLGSLLHTPRIHPVLFRAGVSLGGTGHVAAAVDHFRDLHQIAERHLGPNHPDTLAARHELARWRGRAGDPVGAAKAYAELLTDRLQLLGGDHPQTLATRNSLAAWRGAAGDATGAAAAFAALLTDQAKILGLEHRQTLTTRNNLAYQRGQAGDAAGAAHAFAELLSDQARILGPDDPETLVTRSNLARFHRMTGDISGALDQFTALLPDMRRILGPDHPDTMAIRHRIADIRGSTGDATGAATTYAELLNDRMRILGPDHPHTLANRHSLARCRGIAGNPAGAATALAELLGHQSRVLGPDHPDTLTTRRELACWNARTGDTTEALRNLDTLLHDMLRVLGPEHPETLATRHELLDIRGTGGDPAGAATALAELLTDQMRILGSNHTQTLTTRHRLTYWRTHATTNP
ncbi:FxSxx-COOH system tetratricopeptide repeat protein [Micromonospora ureilytica]|uniref:FxSxx-COOH system tetratricopeptide repeat protein n=1 Tax=Micromonospora ureilytica TaxID=709868 RepID=UPI0033C595DD